MNPTPTATNSVDALNNLGNFTANAKSPDQILQEQNQATGVNAAQQTLTGLRGAIANTTNLLQQVAPSIMGRTANSLVTSAQANHQIANEQAPIQQDLSTEGTQYGNATQDYTNATQQAQTAANLEYSGQKDQQSYLQNLYDTLYGKEQDAAKMAEQQREFDAQQAAAASFNLDNSPAADTSTASDPTQNPLYLSTFYQPNGQKWSDQALISDYNATSKSAQYGNTRDQQKIALYKTIRPDLFGGTSSFVNTTANTPLALNDTTSYSLQKHPLTPATVNKTVTPGNVYLGTY